MPRFLHASGGRGERAPQLLDGLARPLGLAGAYGSGCVFVTGQDPDWHAHYANNVHATLMIRNAVNWAAQC